MRHSPLSLVVTAALLSPPSAAPVAAGELRFEAVAEPTSAADQSVIRATPGASLDGHRFPLTFKPLLRAGDRIGSGRFAAFVDAARRPLVGSDGGPVFGSSPDFTSLLSENGRLWAVSHIEDLPSALYLSRLRRDGAGSFEAVDTRPLNLSFLGGIYNPCAGQVTPWGTHLGGEEYPPDARAFAAAIRKRDAAGLTSYLKRALPYHGIAPEKPDFGAIRQRFQPYRYGFPFEVRVAGWRDVKVERHYAMGRFSHELVAMMPDRRTAYMSDDGENTGFFMFVADRAGDLSAGHLYAARWDQVVPPAQGGTSARITWVGLGHAQTRDVMRAVDRGITFDRLFETAEMSEAGACPTGFTAVNFVGEVVRRSGECLKVKSGQDMLASRLETRRYAALKGATTEFNKGEGLTLDPARKRLYAAMTSIDRGMVDYGEKNKPSQRFDRGGPNHIRLPYNPCGIVFQLDLGPDPGIGSDWVATAASPLLAGRVDPAGSAATHNLCAADGISNPDNLTFIAEHDTLVIAEDSDDGHLNNAVWAYDVGRQTLTRIMTVALGAEASGVYWYPDVDGSGYLTAIMQHPFDERRAPPAGERADRAAVVGVIGPFPKSRPKAGK